MLRYLYKWVCYRALKSGLFLDFYFKRVVVFVMIRIFLIISLFLGDKYSIEYIIFKFFSMYNYVLSIFVNYFNLSYLQLVTIFIVNLFFFIFFFYLVFLS